MIFRAKKKEMQPECEKKPAIKFYMDFSLRNIYIHMLNSIIKLLLLSIGDGNCSPLDFSLSKYIILSRTNRLTFYPKKDNQLISKWGRVIESV